MKISIRLVLTAALLLPAALAQSMSGTLSGTVADSSGAVIPGASVIAQNTRSQDLRKTTTNGEGVFTFPALPAATYKVVVQKPGFAKWEQSNITLNGGDTLRIAASLPVATSSEMIEVVGSATAVAVMDSGEKSALISAKELQDLSLVGRDASELIKILPGAAMVANGGVNGAAYSGQSYGMNSTGGLGGSSINGQGVDITMDGGHTFDPGAFGSSTPVNPNVEMVQEVKVLTSNFSAENAKGPVVMNTVSKAGGKDFHGEAYFFARNSALNSNDWNANASGLAKSPSSQYYPGGNIGGPVIIPGTRLDKEHTRLFFFEGYEYYKQNLYGGIDRAYVPTDAERNGDFSKAGSYGQLQGLLGNVPCGSSSSWCTANGGNIVNGIIPAAQIDPGGKVMLNLYPKANTDAASHNGYNYQTALTTPQHSWQSLSRIDFNVSDNTKLFVRYNVQRENWNSPGGLWQTPGCDNCVPSPSNIIGNNAVDSWAVNLTHVFSPTMTSETTFSYTYINFPNSPADPSKLQRKESGFPYKGIYGTAVTNPVLLQWWSGAIPNLGTGGYNYHPTMQAEKAVLSFGENLAKVLGTHTMKAGFYYEQLYNNQDDWQQSNGTFNYETGSTNSNNTYADILMGEGFVGYNESQQTPKGNMGERIVTFYAQDSWKLTRRLTLEYGIRFEHIPQPWDRGGIGMAVFNPATYSNDPAQLAAHTGLDWHGRNKNIPIAGADSRAVFFSPRFGLAYDAFGTGKTVVRGGWGKFRQTPTPDASAYVNAWGTAAGSSSYSCGFNQANCMTWASIDQLNAPTATQGPGAGLTSINVVGKNNDEQQLTTSYSFSIDQQLPYRLTLEASYVGNQGNYLMTTNAPDINAIPLFTPGVATSSNTDAYRPRTNYQSINQSVPIIKSQYDALQLSLHRRTGWVNLQANYTFSKSMGNQANLLNGALPNYGENYYWGVTQGNRPQVFSVAYTLTLPKMVRGNALVHGVVNGWQISGISQVESGSNLLAQNSSNFSYSQDGASAQTNLGSPSAPMQPILTCNPTSNLKSNQYVNPACFAASPVGVLGTGAFPYIPGPAFFSNDISLDKTFKVTEVQKLQFRLSMFNPLNHPLTTFHASDNNLKLNYTSAASGSTLKNSQFGTALYKTGFRTIEVSAKYTF